MKKLYLFLCLIFIATGCQSTKKDDKTFNITTSFYPIYIFAENITQGAENISLSNLAQPQTGCLHDYQLSASDMKSLMGTDFLIINGAGMESFMQNALEIYPEIIIGDSSKSIELAETSESHEHGEDKHELNSHIWLSIKNAEKQIINIAYELSLQNPQNKNIYMENAERFIYEISHKTKDISNQILEITSKKPLKAISFHEGFDYFANDYNIEIVKSIIFDENKQPSAKEIADIIDKIKSENIKAIFTSEGNGMNLANIIASETNVKVYKIDPITSGDMSKDSYTNIMIENLETILEASKKND